MLENELFEFLEGTTDAAFSVNQQGEILSWNRAAERLFGYSTSEVLGKSCSHRMALRTLLRLLQGRPRPSLRRGGSGIRASRIAHWRSVSSRALRRSIGFAPENCQAIVESQPPGARSYDDDEPKLRFARQFKYGNLRSRAEADGEAGGADAAVDV